MSMFEYPVLHRFKRFVSCALERATNNGDRSFAKDESGAVAIIFAVMLIPMILMIGVAIDYSRIALDRAQTQSAIDAAALAVVKKVSLLKDDEIKAMVKDYVKANIPSDISVTIDRIDIARDPSELKIYASGSTDTTFMRIAHINSARFEADSRAEAGDRSIEIVLVLDNSGSMYGSRLRGLKEAAKELIEILEDNQQSKEDLSIGVVPFNHLVRLDTGSLKEKWIDTKGKSSLHRLNMPPKTKRLQTFKTLRDPNTGKSEEWEGCVEARKHPYDVEDSAASKTAGDSYFVPFFYPDTDERSVKNRNRSYWENRYLPVRGFVTGMTQSQKKKYGWYHKQTFINGRGPNKDCYVKRILPMTTNMDAVRSHITGMVANGWTNIHMGTIWGLRLLSPQAPYTQGKSFDDDENVKFLIVMSDGANTYTNRHHAYGWSRDGRISGSGSVVSEMNKRTLESCTAAKSSGVTVYTIAYGNIGSSTTQMLADCASRDNTAFTPQSTSDMINVFKEIAEALNAVRLTQ